jgi:trehalose 6-phosphate synthase/phosphatase
MSMTIVSNRLPVVLEHTDGKWTTRPGAGGLISAFIPALRRWGGSWIGWPGIAGAEGLDLDAVLAESSAQERFRLTPVPLSHEEYERFYKGFSNEIIWPLFHDLQSRCNFAPEYWTSYTDVQSKFAAVVEMHAQPGDVIWVQDYHLMGLGQRLREAGVENHICFFLHIPFPPPDIYCKLPWRKVVLESLLHYDLIGLQTAHDLENFRYCLKLLLPDAEYERHGDEIHIRHGGHESKVGAFPIGIDFDEFATQAASAEARDMLRDLHEKLPGQQIILGLDRLDYTKGIPYRLNAFELALRKYPELHRAVTLLQVVVPSRETVPEYQDLKAEIERCVARINGEWTQPGWVPIHYVFRSLTRKDVIAYYRLADIALVTPLKDGMNLVAKEYCACQVDGNGVLILSEFAGAAAQLKRGAVLVNPYDLDAVASAIRDAVLMTPEQRQPAMSRLRKNVREENVYWWFDKFMRACGVELTPRREPRYG